MAEDAFNQKDRDQDVALLRLETAVARLDEWKIRMDAFYTERDRRYESRFTALETGVGERFDSAKTAVDAALAAQEKAVNAAFAASEKAIIKAEDAQREYNTRSNEFRGSLDDQGRLMLSRTEGAARFADLERRIEEMKSAYDDQISGLREWRSADTGKISQNDHTQAQSNWLVMAVLGGLSFFISMIAVGSSIVIALSR